MGQQNPKEFMDQMMETVISDLNKPMKIEHSFESKDYYSIYTLPECALGYKKIVNGMVTFPMILDGFWTRKKVSLKYLIASFQKIAISNL